MQSIDSSWIVVSDLHGNTRRLSEIPELSCADGILVSGDITTSGGRSAASCVLKTIEQINTTYFALFGNMDKPDVALLLHEQNRDLHRAVRVLSKDTAIIGVGGSSHTPMRTPSEFSEEHIAEWLHEMWLQARHYQHIILISHTPPLDTSCDRLCNGRHVGSSAVRNFIVEHQPDICLCGHIHEARGEDKIGNTVIVNSGKLDDGGYAVLTLGETKPSVKLYLLS